LNPDLQGSGLKEAAGLWARNQPAASNHGRCFISALVRKIVSRFWAFSKKLIVFVIFSPDIFLTFSAIDDTLFLNMLI